MLETIKKAVLRLFPELSANLHLDRYARITSINDTPLEGSASERFRPRYSVDLTILTPALEPDPTFPVYRAVPLPVGYGAGEESGLFAFPEPGALVVIGFAYGRPDHPIVRQIYPLGASLPHVGAKELVLQQAPDVYARADDVGNWQRRARFDISEKSQSRLVTSLDYILRAANEHKKVSQHSVAEIEGISRLEAAIVDVLGAIKVDIGTLGDLNLTAGGDSTFSTAGSHTQTIGGTRFNVTKGDDVVNIEGGQTFTTGADVEATIGGMVKADITADLLATIGGNETLTITGNHVMSAAASTETIAGAKTISAGGAATIAGASAALVGAAAAIAVGATITMTGKTPSGESVSIMDELVDCLDNIIKAESEFAKGVDISTGGFVGNPTPYINAARQHWNKIKSAT